MDLHLERLQSAAHDLDDVLSLAQRALARIHQELADARAKAAGQTDLPLAGAPTLICHPQDADALDACACGHARGNHLTTCCGIQDCPCPGFKYVKRGDQG